MNSPEPIYQQIRNQVVEAVASGQLKPGESLPATRALAAELAINYHTVNKAYEMLVHEGFITLARGRGAVIQPRPSSPSADFREEWTARLRSLLAEAIAQGLPAHEIQDACRRLVDQLAVPDRPETL